MKKTMVRVAAAASGVGRTAARRWRWSHGGSELRSGSCLLRLPTRNDDYSPPEPSTRTYSTLVASAIFIGACSGASLPQQFLCAVTAHDCSRSRCPRVRRIVRPQVELRGRSRGAHRDQRHVMVYCIVVVFIRLIFLSALCMVGLFGGLVRIDTCASGRSSIDRHQLAASDCSPVRWGASCSPYCGDDIRQHSCCSVAMAQRHRVVFLAVDCCSSSWPFSIAR